MLNIHVHALFTTIMMFYGPLNWEIGLLNIGLFFEGCLRMAVQKGVTSVTLGRGKNGHGKKEIDGDSHWSFVKIVKWKGLCFNNVSQI
jgi:hypothetical protein